MKQFTIYTNPQGSYEAVKQGWSWTTFGFNIWWALTKKMWALGFGVLGVSFALGVLGGIAGASVGKMETAKLIMNVAGVAMHVVFGAYGNQWRRTILNQTGSCSRTLLLRQMPRAQSSCI